MVRAAAAAFRLLLSGAGTGVNLNKEHWAQQRFCRNAAAIYLSQTVLVEDAQGPPSVVCGSSAITAATLSSNGI